ncbi:Trehalose-6-phosphate phosphatase [bacterium YEK0313]|nr:Trehalose-6-phosphate phosphatase [bacterium YEK0313]
MPFASLDHLPLPEPLSPHELPAVLAQQIGRKPADFAIFFDFDGTLADIADTPEEVVLPPGLATDLTHLQQVLGGAVAIVTGRHIADVQHMIAPAWLPGSGLHGLEFSFNRAARAGASADAVAPALLARAVALAADHPGVRLEYKGPILAVHFRRNPNAAATLMNALAHLLAELDLRHHLKEGRAVIEVIPDGTSKATALETILRRPPFAGRIPVMIGDDRADEDAFVVAEAAGGFGLQVAGEHFAADGAHFANPAAVRAWLSGIAGARR